MRLIGAWVGLGLASVAAMFAVGHLATAADHLDPPTRTDPASDATPDVAADIADVYAWQTDTKFIVALSFAGPRPTTEPAYYDRDVLYTINIANGPVKTVATFPIKIRFGVDNSNGTPRYGVKVSGVPGVSGDIIGPVEAQLEKDGVIVKAGLFDDPFFFDVQGFRASRSTGVLQISNKRDFFAGQNLTVVIIEMPRSRIENGSNLIGIWTTSKRFGGNL
jgi:hypothetical protein